MTPRCLGFSQVRRWLRGLLDSADLYAGIELIVKGRGGRSCLTVFLDFVVCVKVEVEAWRNPCLA